MKPRLLANENVPAPSVTLLRNVQFNVLAIAESHPGLSDRSVLDLAVADSRWIVTFDRDYGELIYARRMPPPPALVLVRIRSYRPEEPGQLLAELLAEPSRFAGQFVVVEEGSIRIRPLPDA
jgi:predicted nuclease of predicted toxin-antitoxin system